MAVFVYSGLAISTGKKVNGVHYADALPAGIDLAVAPTTSGVKTTYVLPDAAAADQPISEQLTLPEGWTARQVGDAIDAIYYALGIIAGLTVKEETYPEVAAQEAELWDVRNRVSFILDYIRSKQETVQ